jgi:DNA topoisomerase-1
MKTIDRRGYVWKKGKSLVPAFRAFAVVNLLQTYFADLVDYQFTAAMEDQLDEIAQGTQDLEPWLQKFYFGDPSAQTELAKRWTRIRDPRTARVRLRRDQLVVARHGPDGVEVSVRSGRYGPYLVHGDDRASIPEATEPDSLSVDVALELLAAPSNDRELGTRRGNGLAHLLEGRSVRTLRAGR